jgi:hypothetical protein
MLEILIGILLTTSLVTNVAQTFIIKAGLRREDKLTKTLFVLKSSFYDCLNSMRELDDRQMFEKDDEVGHVFKKLTDTIEKTNEEIEKYNEE